MMSLVSKGSLFFCANDWLSERNIFVRIAEWRLPLAVKKFV